MGLLQKLFGKEPRKLTEEERTFQELRQYINDLKVPCNVKKWLKEAVKEAKKGNKGDYQRALEHIDPIFVSDEFSARAELLLKVERPKDNSYWLSRAEEKAREGDLEYRSDLANAGTYLGLGNIDFTGIKSDKKRIDQIFEDNKWSKIPRRLEDKLRLAVCAMASGEQQAQVNRHLDQAEEYAKVLGYSIKGLK